MFESFREQMELFECVFEIEVDGVVKNSRIQAPRIAIEQQFMSLAQQAANSTQPVKIKMRRTVLFYHDYEDKWANIENSITLMNNAYTNIKGDNL